MARKKAKAKRPSPKAKAAKPRKKRVSPVPRGMSTITPYMALDRCNDAIQFYQQAFGAKLLYTLHGPDGRIGHAELRIGDSVVMMADESPQMGVFAPKPGDSVPIKLHIATKDVDAFVAKAVKAGATLTRPVEDQFYGMRSGLVTDPFGYTWFVATQFEVVSPKQMQKRLNAILSKMPSGSA